MADYQFKYSPLTGRLTGNQMIEQTEQAINALASQVDSAAGQVEIISTLANEANENAATALETAEEALSTTGRTYITVSTQADANDYYDSQLIYIANDASTNIPVADTGMLEAKTNDNKTACEQVFIADSSGDAYYRHGDITAETVGDVTTYTVTWGGWSSQPASQVYVQQELTNYLPLSGGTVTGGLTVEGTIAGNLTGNVTGNADTATNATNDANGNPIAGTYLPLAGGTMTGNLTFEADPAINASADNQNVAINGGTAWDKGAWVSVWGKDHATYPGYFALHANNGTNDYALVGRPSGSLVWNNNPVGIIGNLADGHGILTGSVSNISVTAHGYTQGTVNFGQTYSSAPTVVANCSYGHAHVYVGCYSVTTTGFSYIVSNENSSAFSNEKISWIAIG